MLVCHPRDLRSCDIARHVGKFYRLVLREPAQPIPSSRDTAVWRLVAGSRVYLAKVFAPGQIDTVRAETELLDYLSRNGLRVPKLLANKYGNRVSLIGRRFLPVRATHACPLVVTLLEELETLSPQTVKREELTLVARCIGFMHRALRAYPQRANIRRLEYWARISAASRASCNHRTYARFTLTNWPGGGSSIVKWSKRRQPCGLAADRDPNGVRKRYELAAHVVARNAGRPSEAIGTAAR